MKTHVPTVQDDKTGLFLTLEGLDGAGKSTQMWQLQQYLTEQGQTVCMTREPGGTPISEKIRTLILDPAHTMMHPWTEALLYAASRAQHMAEVIHPALKRGEVVLCDRFIDSSLAYQGGGRGLGLKEVFEANRPALMNRLPDRTFWFNLTPEEALLRKGKFGAKDRLEIQADEFRRTVHQTYRQLAKDNPERIVVIDASQKIEEIQVRLREEVDRLLAVQE